MIEAKLDRGRGPVATVLVQRGTLQVGDIIVAGAEMGRVRALINDQGETIDEAGPSVPVEVLGFNGPPEAGDRMAVVENEARAREVTSYRAHQKRENAAASVSGMRGSLEQMMSQLKTTGRKDFPLIIKADVQGSLEAILGSLEKLGTDEVAARILHAGVGGISESDVTLAEGFNAAIIGFNVRAHKEAAAAAKRNGIEIRYYNIIYDLVDDVKKAMSGLLGADAARDHAGQRADPGSVQHFQGRQGRRLPRHRRHRGTRRQCPPDPRQCRGARRQAVDAETLQGRSEGSGLGPGMRHGVRELRRHAPRRRHRMLSRGDDPALSVSPSLTGELIFILQCGVMAGLVPAIHVLAYFNKKDVDARDKRGHDDFERRQCLATTRKTSAPGGSQRQLRVGEIVRHAVADILAQGACMIPNSRATSSRCRKCGCRRT